MHGPIAASLRSDAEYRDNRAAMAARPAEYFTYQPSHALTGEVIQNPRYVPVGASALEYDRLGSTTRERGASKPRYAVPLGAAPYYHGGLDQGRPEDSSALRVGEIVRGALPPPWTPLVGQGKYQSGNGGLDVVDTDTHLRAGFSATPRRGGEHTWTPLLNASGLRQSDTYTEFPEQTAERARGKAWIAEVEPVAASEVAPTPPLAVEDFVMGGSFTRTNLAEFGGTN